MIWIGILIGLLLGASAGVLAAALCSAANRRNGAGPPRCGPPG